MALVLRIFCSVPVCAAAGAAIIDVTMRRRSDDLNLMKDLALSRCVQSYPNARHTGCDTLMPPYARPDRAIQGDSHARQERRHHPFQRRQQALVGFSEADCE